MSALAFSARTRNAGNLETENKLFGSFRSLNKFDPNFVPRSIHDDIFANEEKFDIEPVKDDIPPQESKTSEEKLERKKSRRHREEKTKEKDENGKSERRRSSSKSRKEKADGEEVKDKKEKSSRKEKEKKNEEEEIIETIRQRRQRRHKALEQENVNKENTDSSKPPIASTSTSKIAKSESENQKNVLKNRRSNSFVKTAFEEPEVPPVNNKDSESDNEADAKIDIDHKQKPNEPINQGQEMPMALIMYYKSIRDGNTLDFILTPPPQGHTINCKIICKKGLFNEFYFYIENISENDLFILKAHRKATSFSSHYNIDTINYDQFGNQYSTDLSCARIVSNMSRKKFKLELSQNFVQVSNNEILNIAFRSNVGEPRKVLASASLCSGVNFTKDRVTYFMKNRQPVFDHQRKKYVLNYSGRARQSSKNNFQIVDESFPDDILMQLGKVQTSYYNCDYSFPVCALQAFGYALSSLCR